MIRYILSIFCIVWFFTACQHNPNRPTRIVLIHSYASNSPSYIQLNKQLEKNLKEQGITPEIQTFYLDCETLLAKQEIDTLYNYMNEIQNWKPDLLLVNDDQAHYSLLKCNHPFLKTLPIIISGVNFPNWNLIKQYPNVTGFWDKPDYLKNVRFITDMMGPMRISTNYDTTALGKLAYNSLKEQLSGTEIQLNYSSLYKWDPNEFWMDSTSVYNEYQQNLQRPESSIVTFIPFRNGVGSIMLYELSGLKAYTTFLNYKYDHTSIALGRIYNYPSFTAIRECFTDSRGYLGGYFSSIEILTKEQAELASDILRGKQVLPIPLKESEKEYLYDWEEMQRWQIKTDDIPNYVRIANMPFYERNKILLSFIGSLIAVAIIYIIAHLTYLYTREERLKRKALLNLRKEKESLSLALEGGNIFAWHYENGTFSFDKDFFTFVLIEPRTFTPKQFIDFIYPDDKERFITRMDEFMSGHINKHTEQYRCNFNQKGFQWWEFRHGQSESNHKPGNYLVNGLCLNIQNIKDTELSLIAARKKAEESDRLKSAFLANMSHEIRTPLNAIVGFSNLLTEEEMSGDEKEEYIGIINKNCDLLLKLISDILDLSRIESGRMSFTYAECDLTTLINDIYSTQQLMMPKGVELRKDTPTVPVLILTDRLRLNQVITNFINNAVKFTQSGYIKVGYMYRLEDNTVHVSVEDTGVGIPEEQQKSVFERFNKLDEFAQGTGLGLAICQVIIAQFRGHIQLSSKPGKGSCFTIVLPLLKKPEISETEVPETREYSKS